MKNISHKGIVKSIDGNNIIVNIVAMSACASCKSKSMCQLSESKDKEIGIWTLTPEKYKVGDNVNVNMRQDLGLKAVFWAYVMPLIVLVLSLFIFAKVLGSELYGALIAVGMTGLYFLGMKFFSKHFEKKFTFVID